MPQEWQIQLRYLPILEQYVRDKLVEKIHSGCFLLVALIVLHLWLTILFDLPPNLFTSQTLALIDSPRTLSFLRSDRIGYPRLMPNRQTYRF